MDLSDDKHDRLNQRRKRNGPKLLLSEAELSINHNMFTYRVVGGEELLWAGIQACGEGVYYTGVSRMSSSLVGIRAL